MSKSKKVLSPEEQSELLKTLKTRFEKQSERHEEKKWEDVEKRLVANPESLWSVNEMERTGGEPDVVAHEEETGTFVFFDCVKESPKERRSYCYDRAALEARKKFPPENTAIDVATEMGVELLTEEDYRYLQTLGEFDLKTSSWLHTPESVRERGGAIFGDRRYDRVFVYHNGADSYYAARGFRGKITV